MAIATTHPDAVWILEIIASAQSAGFSLDQIRHLLPLGYGNWQHDALLDALKQKVVEIEDMQKRLKQNRANLLAAIKNLESRPLDMTCSDRARWALGILGKLALCSGVACRGDGGWFSEHSGRDCRWRPGSFACIWP